MKSGYARASRTLLLAAALGAAWAAAGCGEKPEEVVGRACKSNDDCDGLAEGFCGPLQYCTRKCTANSDCGCAPGTTDDLVADGTCRATCQLGECERACSANKDCDRGVCEKYTGKLSICE